MELYTSLTRIKMAMNGGQMPAMSPLSRGARVYLDPEFCIGMGAFMEDEHSGLRCPVRGCGKYFHMMKVHLDRIHKNVGGSERVRSLLSIPRSARLVSSTMSRKISAATEAGNKAHDRLPSTVIMRSKAWAPETRKRAGQTQRNNVKTVGYRNLHDRCRAQLQHRLIDLEHRLGRPLMLQDAEQAFGGGFPDTIYDTFGSWANAVQQCGLSATQGGMSQDDVYDALREYYHRNGQLPSYSQSKDPTRVPLLPSQYTVLRVLGTSSWATAMAQAAFVLGIENHKHTKRGTKGNSKLDADEVREIRRRATSGDTDVSLAVDYGVSRKAIYDAVRGITWKSVEADTLEGVA